MARTAAQQKELEELRASISPVRGLSLAQSQELTRLRSEVEPQQAPQQLSTGGVLEAITEPLQTMGSAIANLTVGGLAGLVATANPFAEPGAGARVVEAFQRQISQPETEAGRTALEDLGKFTQIVAEQARVTPAAIAGLIEFSRDEDPKKIAQTIRSVFEKGTGETAAIRILEETKDIDPKVSAVMATIARIGPEAILEFFGMKGIGGILDASVARGRGVLTGVFDFQTPGKREIAKLLEESTPDARTAGFELAKDVTPQVKEIGFGEPRSIFTDEPTRLNLGGPDRLAAAIEKGSARIVKEPIAQEAIRQGFDSGVVAAVDGANQATKTKMIDMTKMMKRIKTNPLEGQTIRPLDIVGDSIQDRFKIVFDAKTQAGRDIDRVATGLKGNPDFSQPVETFINDLQDLGITFGKQDKLGNVIPGTETVPNFELSSIEFDPPSKKLIKDITKRMRDVPNPNARQGHLLKKLIDSRVVFGRRKQGLTGEAESIVKRLRNGIDGVLDTAFPEYNRANTAFKETIEVLNAFQELAPKRVNLLGPDGPAAAGNLSLRIMSNAASGIPVKRSVLNLDKLAQRLVAPGKQLIRLGDAGRMRRAIDDDIFNLLLYGVELDRRFGTVAKTSLQGRQAAAIAQQGFAATAGGRGAISAGIDIAARLGNRAKGVTDDAAFRSILELLRRK